MSDKYNLTTDELKADCCGDEDCTPDDCVQELECTPEEQCDDDDCPEKWCPQDGEPNCDCEDEPCAE